MEVSPAKPSLVRNCNSDSAREESQGVRCDSFGCPHHWSTAVLYAGRTCLSTLLHLLATDAASHGGAVAEIPRTTRNDS